MRVNYSKLEGFKPSKARCCVHCGKALRPLVALEELPNDATGEGVVKRYNRKVRPVRIEGYGYGGDGLFCSLTCGYVHAVKKERVRSV